MAPEFQGFSKEASAETVDLSVNGAVSESTKNSTVRMTIVDTSLGDRNPLATPELIADGPFRTFATKILAGLEEVVDARIFEFEQISFTRIPLAGDDYSANIGPIEKIDWDCLIVSPWAQVAVKRDAPRLINANFLWNERQLLRDQAVALGLERDDVVPSQSISWPGFTGATTVYTNFLMTGSGSEPPEIAAMDQDLLFLFRNAPQSTFAPFSQGALSALSTLSESVSEYYGDLVVDLVQRCFEKESVQLSYSSISDVDDFENDFPILFNGK